MAIFGFGSTPSERPATLIDQLSSKAATLRADEEKFAKQSERYTVAAVEAANKSVLNADHALAVEKAYKIITDAGVTL